MNQGITMSVTPENPRPAPTLKDLMRHSIEIVPRGVTVVWPQFNSKEEIIYPQETVSKFNGRFYAANNSTIAYVSDDHRLFVAPFTTSIHNVLLRNRYVEKHFHVPFSNGDYPKHAAERWNALRQAAHREYCAERVRTCYEWSDQHNIGFIDDKLLAHTLEVPETGIPFHSPRGYDDVYFGEYQNSVWSGLTTIGRFCRNNGVVAFVYRDGYTYIARGYRHIIPALLAAGYTEAAFFVPLSNGETITDAELAGKWESLKH